MLSLSARAAFRLRILALTPSNKLSANTAGLGQTEQTDIHTRKQSSHVCDRPGSVPTSVRSRCSWLIAHTNTPICAKPFLTCWAVRDKQQLKVQLKVRLMHRPSMAQLSLQLANNCSLAVPAALPQCPSALIHPTEGSPGGVG